MASLRISTTRSESRIRSTLRLAIRCIDQVRRRFQNETLGDPGRKHDPLYRIRKLLLTGDERLDERDRDRMLLGLRAGDPNDEVVGTWLAKESVRDVYLAERWHDAHMLLTKTIRRCLADHVPEVHSLGTTFKRARLRRYAEKHPRWVDRRAYAVLRREGQVENRKKHRASVARENLRVLPKCRKRQRLGTTRTPYEPLRAERPDHVWTPLRA